MVAGVIKFICLGMLCLGMMPITACSLLPQHNNVKTALLKPVQDKVILLELERGSISKEMAGVGTLVPGITKYLQFKTDGKLADVNLQPGDPVRKGEIVLRLDEGDISLQVKEQQLIVENMKRALAVSQMAKQAEAVTINRMNVDIEQMRLEALMTKSAKQQIISPIDGIITFLDPFKQGDQVLAYSSVIGISSTKGLRIEYIKSEAGFTGGIEVDMPVSVMYHHQNYQAKVTAKKTDKNEEALMIDFDHEPADASIGENADFIVITDHKENVIKIPRNALHISSGSNFVRVMQGNNIKEVDVQTGLITATEVEIVKGLKEHQQIVLN